MAMQQKFFTPSQEKQIVEAIRAFERLTSGEIRVHVERTLRRPPLDEAAVVFRALGMHETAQRNGVLILLAPLQKSFAIYGDSGIYERCTHELWEEARDVMREYFRREDYTGGLLEGIRMAGTALAAYFPVEHGDINELPDDISYG